MGGGVMNNNRVSFLLVSDVFASSVCCTLEALLGTPTEPSVWTPSSSPSASSMSLLSASSSSPETSLVRLRARPDSWEWTDSKGRADSPFCFSRPRACLFSCWRIFFPFFLRKHRSRAWDCFRGLARSRRVKRCWPLLGCVEVNMGDVGEEGNRRQIVNRAGQEIVLTAVFFHQGVCLTRVKEDLIWGHQQDSWNHTLMQKTTDISPAKGNGTGWQDSEGTAHPPYSLWCSGRAVWGTARPLVPPPHRIQVAEPTSKAVHQASAPPPHPVNNRPIFATIIDELTSWSL